MQAGLSSLRSLACLSVAISLLFAVPASGASAVPEGFVYLRDVDASIVQDMRYFGDHNFLGRRVKGYEAAECILTRKAATALAGVQRRLKLRGLSLKVYDCYRPARAVADFVTWSETPGDEKTRAEFYPDLEKKRLFKLGYIARRSGHSRGSTVDLTIVAMPPAHQPAFSAADQKACTLPVGQRFADNSLDFGTGYDCFDDRSHTANPAVGTAARGNRMLLLKEMAAAGFENYRREWWHFSLADEPYPKTYFDFPIRVKAP